MHLDRGGHLSLFYSSVSGFSYLFTQFLSLQHLRSGGTSDSWGLTSGEVQSLLEFPDEMLKSPGSWGRVNETTHPTALFYFVFVFLLIAAAKVPV